MTPLPLVTRHPAYARRLGAAAVLAASALFATTTGTVADPATACAKPKRPGVNWAAFDSCMKDVEKLYGDGKISDETYENLEKTCCEMAGGVWRRVKPNVTNCGPATNDSGAHLPRFPDVGEATATLIPVPPPPPAGPVAPVPNVLPVQTG